MRVILVFLVFISLTLGYEINHENEGKFYRFTGSADGMKFELYLNYFDVEFENFKESKNLFIPTKIGGHLFFNGLKFEFNKGKIEKNDTQVTAVSALSEWLNLDVRLNENSELTGKLAIKGKAYKAELKQDMSYSILAHGVQVIDTNGTKFEAIASNVFSDKFSSKHRKILKGKIANFKRENLENPEFNFANDILSLEFQNSEIKSVCSIKSKTDKICKTTLLEGLKGLNLSDIFQNLGDKNLKAIFEKNRVVASENFTLSAAGISFYDEGEKTISIEEIKPFLKQNFGLFE